MLIYACLCVVLYGGGGGVGGGALTSGDAGAAEVPNEQTNERPSPAASLEHMRSAPLNN